MSAPRPTPPRKPLVAAPTAVPEIPNEAWAELEPVKRETPDFDSLMDSLRKAPASMVIQTAVRQIRHTVGHSRPEKIPYIARVALMATENRALQARPALARNLEYTRTLLSAIRKWSPHQASSAIDRWEFQTLQTVTLQLNESTRDELVPEEAAGSAYGLANDLRTASRMLEMQRQDRRADARRSATLDD